MSPAGVRYLSGGPAHLTAPQARHMLAPCGQDTTALTQFAVPGRRLWFVPRPLPSCSSVPTPGRAVRSTSGRSRATTAGTTGSRQQPTSRESGYSASQMHQRGSGFVSHPRKAVFSASSCISPTGRGSMGVQGIQLLARYPVSARAARGVGTRRISSLEASRAGRHRSTSPSRTVATRRRGPRKPSLLSDSRPVNESRVQPCALATGT